MEVKVSGACTLGQLPEQSGKPLVSECPESGNPLPTTSGTLLAILHLEDALRPEMKQAAGTSNDYFQDHIGDRTEYA